MSWASGFDGKWNRDIGYGVPAYCDHPKCMAEIDRGLAHVCGGEPYGGDYGCGLYFCSGHLYIGTHGFRCNRCNRYRAPYKPKPEHPGWIKHKLTNPSWQPWRDENPLAVKALLEAPHD